MARPSKRKSDSALLGKTKTKQSRLSEKARASSGWSGSDGDASELEPAIEEVEPKYVKQRDRARGEITRLPCGDKPGKKGKTDKVDEYDEDIGRMQSQAFLSIVESETRNKNLVSKESSQYMRSLIESLKDDEEKLKRAIKDSTTAAEKEDAVYLESFKQAYGASRIHVKRCLDDQQSQATSWANFSSLYKASQDSTKKAFELVKLFESVAAHVQNSDLVETTENQWGAQFDQTRDLLSIGKEIGIRKCQAVITDRRCETNSTNQTADIERKFYGGLENGVWGKVARKQEKAFGRICSGLTRGFSG